MISSHFDTMVSALRPARDFALFRPEDFARLPRPVIDRFRSEAEKAVTIAHSIIPLSEILESPASALDKQQTQRERLAALALGEAVMRHGEKGRYLRPAADLLYALCEEGCWRAPSKSIPPQLSASPDALAMRTAELISWVTLLIGRELEGYAPGLVARAHSELSRRVLRYCDDGAYCEVVLRNPKALDMARALTVVCCATPQNETDRWLRLKNALRIVDRCLSGGWLAAVYAREGLTGWREAACAAADATLLADVACGGDSGLREDQELRREARLPVDLHISRQWFLDDASAMRPVLPAADIYRLGAIYDDDELCALGASLFADEDPTMESSATIWREGMTGALLNALWRTALIQEQALTREAECVYMPSYAVAASRPRKDMGFYAALRAGALTLFWKGEPVLVNGPGGAQARNVPTPGGVAQTRISAADPQARVDGFPTLSMDLAPSYPPEAMVFSWQRTVMITGEGGVVRVLDAFDLRNSVSGCALRFVTPHRPVIAVGASRARIGPVYVEWESILESSVEPVQIPDGADVWCESLYALVLTRREPLVGGCWTVTFVPA